MEKEFAWMDRVEETAKKFDGEVEEPAEKIAEEVAEDSPQEETAGEVE